MIKGLLERLADPNEHQRVKTAAWKALSDDIGDIIKDISDTYVKKIERKSGLSCPRALHSKKSWMKLYARYP